MNENEKEVVLAKSYQWFWSSRLQKKGCMLWNVQKKSGELACPILARQVQALRTHLPNRKEAVYYPEAIYGDPRSGLWIMGANPGGGGAHDPCRHICPNSLARNWDDQTLDEFRQHHLHYYDDVARTDYLYEVGLAAADALAAGNATLQQKTPAPFAVVNASHCKCPSLSGLPAADHRRLAGHCGEKTLELLAAFQPETVVCLGWDVWKWADALRGSQLWTLEGAFKDVRFGMSTIARWQGNRSTRLFWAPHPARNRLKRTFEVIAKHLPLVG
jgi:hypothetical protein